MAIASLLAGGLAPPTPAIASEITVKLEEPKVSDVSFNAIATWNPVHQEACLYGADSVKPSGSSDQPWVTAGECKLWKPPTGTPSGIYVASWDGDKSRALLVTSAAPIETKKEHLLVLVPDFTWQAYDLVKNGSFYFESVGKKSSDFSARKLNLLRPMQFDVVGDPVNYPKAPQLYPSANPINFLRKHFNGVDVVAQSDFDKNAYELNMYAAIVLYGHDEYWTPKIKSALESAVSSGTPLLNLSGNTGYRKLIRDGEVIGFEPPTAERPRTSIWGENPADSTSIKLLGVQYMGEPLRKRQVQPIKLSRKTFMQLRRDGLPTKVTPQRLLKLTSGILVRDAHDPLFAGTGLKSGQFFGVASQVMSVEVDGVPETSDGQIEKSFKDAFGDAPLKALGDAWVNARQESHARSWRSGELIETTFGKGKVFSAGPIGWAYSLATGDQAVEKITLNALRFLDLESTR